MIHVHAPALAKKGAKDGFDRFFAWVVATMGPETYFLTQRDVELHVWVGVKHVNDAVGRAHAKIRFNDYRWVTGQPKRYRMHISRAVLCVPTELAATIVHETQHLRDLKSFLDARYADVHVREVLLQARMEERASAAERRFWMRTTHAQVRDEHARQLGAFCKENP